MVFWCISQHYNFIISIIPIFISECNFTDYYLFYSTHRKRLTGWKEKREWALEFPSKPNRKIYIQEKKGGKKGKRMENRNKNVKGNMSGREKVFDRPD